MSSSARLPPDSERGQRSAADIAQQHKVRERQRFFEEAFQHDVDMYLSSAHLSIRDIKRPPIGSISSMEVNVDLLDQMELIDISDQDTLDVFFSSSDDSVLGSSLPVQGNNNNNEEVLSTGLFRHVLEGLDPKSRVSSTSSVSSGDSQNMNAAGLALTEGSDEEEEEEEEEAHSGTLKRRAKPEENRAS